MTNCTCTMHTAYGDEIRVADSIHADTTYLGIEDGNDGDSALASLTPAELVELVTVLNARVAAYRRGGFLD